MTDDLISRQAVLNMKRLFIDEDGVMAYAVPTGNILRLPSVQPTRPTGRWINLENTKYKGQVLPFWDRYECSKCGGHGKGTFNYCPNCGADMREKMFRNGCLESIEALMAEGEIYDIEYSPWIPVSERLPEPNRLVLCHITTGVTKTYFLAFWNDIQNDWEEGIGGYRLLKNDLEYEVIAWMSLPQSYKAESEEEK